jgi:adenine deaminase
MRLTEAEQKAPDALPGRSVSSAKSLIRVALAEGQADLYVGNGRILNVYSGEVLDEQNIAIWGGRIAYLGSSTRMVGPDTQVIDAAGSYLLPGYIDPHAHVDFWANPLSLVGPLLVRGTTTVMADPHDVVGALGLPGLDLLVEMTRGLPLKFCFSLPVTSPPFPSLEGDDVVPLEAMGDYLAKDVILALSEVTPWIRLIQGEESLLAKFDLARRWGRRIEGHTSGASGGKLHALVAAGLTSCHESVTSDEALQRLRLGLAVMLRHGSIRSDLEALVSLVTGEPDIATSRIMLTPDWMSPVDVLRRGYMDHLVCRAIDFGMPPTVAIKMATINPATYLRLDGEVGGLAPGRRADVLMVDDLSRPVPRLVIADGRVVARDAQLLFDVPPVPPSARGLAWPSYRVLPKSLSPADFVRQAPFDTGRISVPAVAIADKTITRRSDVVLPVRKGRIRLEPDHDVLQVGVLSKDSSGFEIAFLTGFGARIGGLSSSIAHELHKPIVVGYSEHDMFAALRRMEEMGGGMVLVEQGQILAEIPLLIGGLMSDKPLTEIAAEMQTMNTHLKERGCTLEEPVFSLTFLTFSALPWIRLTPSGLLDVKTHSIIESTTDWALGSSVIAE